MQRKRRLLSPSQSNFGRGPSRDVSEAFSGIEESARAQSVRSEGLPVLPGEPVMDGEIDRSGTSTVPVGQLFHKERELNERELALARQKAHLARNLQQSLALLLVDQDTELRNSNPAVLRESPSQREDVNRLDAYVIHNPVDVIDGMNRVSAYVGGRAFGGKFFQTSSNGISIQVQSCKGPRPQRAVSPVLRVQPLYSPWNPENVLPAFLQQRQQEREQEQQLRQIPEMQVENGLDVAVQTEPATEDATGGKPLTIERDETVTKCVQTLMDAASSTSSLTLTRASGASSRTGSRSNGSRIEHKQLSKSASNGEKEVNKVEMRSLGNSKKGSEAQSPSNETRGDKSSHGETKNTDGPTHEVGVSPPVEPSPPPKSVTGLPSPPVRVQMRTISTTTEGSSEMIGLLESNERDKASRELHFDSGFQCTPPVIRTTAWYVPNSRVLHYAEFKNLLCEESVSPPKSVRFESAPRDCSPLVRDAPVQVSPVEPQDFGLSAENFIIEFPLPPDLSCPDMPPPGRESKTKRSSGCCRPCSSGRRFSCCFPFLKRAKKKPVV
ncbi:hypothetical protein MOQ_000559 [Trypanosoma cruzi marinkellei]|uniref:Uncharacterized protein n=1 Tax=Trypanosoma cruzi marinkellei TaxID=85056 RepID=K2NN61_TRYCR|nr:hypothetical protein MOQ_000559 [Trypanosoma cruzi marinkellei]